MIFVQKVYKEKDGSFSSVWNLSQEQMDYLISYAINDLLRLGVASIKEETEEINESQMQLDFLKAVPIELLGTKQ